MSEYTINLIDDWFEENSYKLDELKKQDKNKLIKQIEKDIDLPIMTDRQRYTIDRRLGIKEEEEEEEEVAEELTDEEMLEKYKKKPKKEVEPEKEVEPKKKIKPVFKESNELTPYDYRLIQQTKNLGESGLGAFKEELLTRTSQLESEIEKFNTKSEDFKKNINIRKKLSDNAKKYVAVYENESLKREKRNQAQRKISKLSDDFNSLQSIIDKLSNELKATETKIKKQIEYNNLLKETFAQEFVDAENTKAAQIQADTTKEIEVPAFWNKDLKIKTLVPAEESHLQYVAVPELISLQGTPDEIDRTFSSAKAIYDEFGVKSISLYTQGKASDLTELNEKIEKEAEKNINSGIRLNPHRKINKPAAVERERKKIIENLTGFSIGKEAVTKNNIKDYMEKIYKDPDLLRAFSTIMYPSGATAIASDFRIMGFAIEASGKYTITEDLTMDPSLQYQHNIYKTQKALHELGSGFEIFRKSLEEYEKLPSHMTENLLSQLSVVKRRKAASLFEEYGRLKDERKVMVHQFEDKVTAATSEKPSNVTTDLKGIQLITRKLRLINNEIEDMFHRKDIPMDTIISDEILKNPEAIDEGIQSLLDTAMMPNINLDIANLQGRNIIIDSISEADINQKVKDYKDIMKIEASLHKDLSEEFWGGVEHVGSYIFGKSTKLRAKEKRSARRMEKVNHLITKLNEKYAQNKVAGNTPAFLKHIITDKSYQFHEQQNRAAKKLANRLNSEITRLNIEADSDEIFDVNLKAMKASGFEINPEVKTLQDELLVQLNLRKSERKQDALMFPWKEDKEVYLPMVPTTAKLYGQSLDKATQYIPAVSKIEDLGTDVMAGLYYKLVDLGLMEKESIPRTVGGPGLMDQKIKTPLQELSLAETIKLSKEGVLTVDERELDRIVDINFRLMAMSGSVMDDAERALDPYLHRLIDEDPYDDYFAKEDFGDNLKLGQYPSYLKDEFKKQIKQNDNLDVSASWDEIKDLTLNEVKEKYHAPEDLFKEEMTYYAHLRKETGKVGFNKLAHDIMGAMFPAEAFDPNTGKLTKRASGMSHLITIAGLLQRVPIETIRGSYQTITAYPEHMSLSLRYLLGHASDEEFARKENDWNSMPSWLARVAAHTAMGERGMMGEMDYIAARQGLDPHHPMRVAFRSGGIGLDTLIHWESSMIKPLTTISKRAGIMASTLQELEPSIMFHDGVVGKAQIGAAKGGLKVASGVAKLTHAGIENIGIGAFLGIGATMLGFEPTMIAIGGTAGITGLRTAPPLLKAFSESKVGKGMANQVANKFYGKEVKTKTIEDVDSSKYGTTFSPSEALWISFRSGLADLDQPLGLTAAALTMNPLMMFVPGAPLVDNIAGSLLHKISGFVQKKHKAGKSYKDINDIKIENRGDLGFIDGVGELLKGRPAALFMKSIHQQRIKNLRGTLTYDDIILYEISQHNLKFATDHPDHMHLFLHKEAYTQAITDLNLTPAETERRIAMGHNTRSKVRAFMRLLGADPDLVAKLSKYQTDSSLTDNILFAQKIMRKWQEPNEKLKQNPYYQRFERYLTKMQTRHPEDQSLMQLNRSLILALAVASEVPEAEFYQSIKPNAPVRRLTDAEPRTVAHDKLIAVLSGIKESHPRLSGETLIGLLNDVINSIQKNTPTLAQVLNNLDLNGFIKNTTTEINGIPHILDVAVRGYPFATPPKDKVAFGSFVQIINNVLMTTIHSLEADRVTNRSTIPSGKTVRDGRLFYQTIAEQFQYVLKERLRKEMRTAELKGQKLDLAIQQIFSDRLNEVYRKDLDNFRSEKSHFDDRKVLFGSLENKGRIETANPIDYIDRFGSNNARSTFSYVYADNGNMVVTSLFGNWVLSEAMKKVPVSESFKRQSVDFFWRKLHILKLIEYAARQGSDEINIPLGEKGIFYQVAGQGKKMGDIQRFEHLKILSKSLADNLEKLKKTKTKLEIDAKKKLTPNDEAKNKKQLQTIKEKIDVVEPKLKKANVELKTLLKTGADAERKFIKDLDADKYLIVLERNLVQQLKEKFGEDSVSEITVEDLFPRKIEMQKDNLEFQSAKKSHQKFLKIKIDDEYFMSLNVEDDVYSPLRIPFEEFNGEQLGDIVVLNSVKEGKHEGPKNAFEFLGGPKKMIDEVVPRFSEERQVAMKAKEELEKEAAQRIQPLERIKELEERLAALNDDIDTLDAIIDQLRMDGSEGTGSKVLIGENYQFKGNVKKRVYRTDEQNPTIIETRPSSFEDGVRVLMIDEYQSPTYKGFIQDKTDKAAEIINQTADIQESLNKNKASAKTIIDSINDKTKKQSTRAAFDKAEIKEVEKAGGPEAYLREVIEKEHLTLTETQAIGRIASKEKRIKEIQAEIDGLEKTAQEPTSHLQEFKELSEAKKKADDARTQNHAKIDDITARKKAFNDGAVKDLKELTKQEKAHKDKYKPGQKTTYTPDQTKIRSMEFALKSFQGNVKRDKDRIKQFEKEIAKLEKEISQIDKKHKKHEEARKKARIAQQLDVARKQQSFINNLKIEKGTKEKLILFKKGEGEQPHIFEGENKGIKQLKEFIDDMESIVKIRQNDLKVARKGEKNTAKVLKTEGKFNKEATDKWYEMHQKIYDLEEKLKTTLKGFDDELNELPYSSKTPYETDYTDITKKITALTKSDEFQAYKAIQNTIKDKTKDITTKTDEIAKLKKDTPKKKTNVLTEEQLKNLSEQLKLVIENKKAIRQNRSIIVDEGLYDFISDSGKSESIQKDGLYKSQTALMQSKYKAKNTETPFSHLDSHDNKMIRELIIQAISEGYTALAWRDDIVGQAIMSNIKMAGGKYAVRQSRKKHSSSSVVYNFVQLSSHDALIVESFIAKIGNPTENGNKALIFLPDVVDVANILDINPTKRTPEQQIKYDDMKKWLGISDREVNINDLLGVGFAAEDAHNYSLRGRSLDDLILNEEHLRREKNKIKYIENKDHTDVQKGEAKKRTEERKKNYQKAIDEIQSLRRKIKPDDQNQQFRLKEYVSEQNYYVPNGTTGNKSKFSIPVSASILESVGIKPDVYVNQKPHIQFEAIWTSEKINIRSQRKLMVIKGISTTDLEKIAILQKAHLVSAMPSLVNGIVTRLSREAAQRGFDGIALDLATTKTFLQNAEFNMGRFKGKEDVIESIINQFDNAFSSIAKEWKVELENDVLLTNHRLLPEGVPIPSYWVDIDKAIKEPATMGMAGRRREHMLTVLPFTGEMYRSVPSKRRVIEVHEPFHAESEYRVVGKVIKGQAEGELKGQMTRYFPNEEVYGIEELFTLLNEEQDTLVLVTPHAKHTFKRKGSLKNVDLEKILPDEYFGGVVDPENLLSKPLQDAMIEVFGSKDLAREAMIYYYNRELFNAYIEKLKESDIQIDYTRDSKAFERDQPFIGGEFSAWDHIKNYRRGGKEIHPDVIRSVFESVSTEFKAARYGKRNPAGNWQRGINAHDTLYIRSGYGLNDIAKLVSDKILSYVDGKENVLNNFDVDFTRAFFATQLLTDHLKLKKYPNDFSVFFNYEGASLPTRALLKSAIPNALKSMKLYDVPLFVNALNNEFMIGVTDLRMNYENIARHIDIDTINEILKEKNIDLNKAKANFISNIQQSYNSKKSLSDVNGEILTHILGLDALNLPGSKIKPKEIVSAFRNPSDFMERLNHTELQKKEPIFNFKNSKLIEADNSPILLIDAAMKAELTQKVEALNLQQDGYLKEYFRMNDLSDSDTAPKNKTGFKQIEFLANQRFNIDQIHKFWQKADEVDDIGVRNAIPRVANPRTQAIIDLVNDGFRLRMPVDATPKDFLMANLKLAEVLLEPQSRKIAKDYYESRGNHLTAVGKAHFLKDLGDFIENVDFNALTGEKVLLLQGAAKFVDLIWLSARNKDRAFSQKTINVFDGLFQPGRRSYLKAAGLNSFKGLRSVPLTDRPERQPGKRSDLKRIKSEERHMPDMSSEELLQWINGPLFEPTTFGIEKLENGIFHLFTPKYRRGDLIPIDQLYHRAISYVQMETMIKSKKYNQGGVGKFIDITENTIVPLKKAKAIKEESADFMRYIFALEDKRPEDLWRYDNVMLLRNKEQLEILKEAPKIEDLSSRFIRLVKPNRFEKIVEFAKQQRKEGLPVPEYMLSVDALKTLYPADPMFDNQAHQIPTFIDNLSTFRHGSIDPESVTFVTEPTFNRMRSYANQLYNLELGKSIDKSIFLDIERRKLPNAKGKIAVTNSEIESLRTAYIDTHAFSNFSRTKIMQNLPKNFAEELSRALYQVVKEFKRKGFFKETIKKVEDNFFRIEKLEAISPKQMDFYKRYLNAAKRLVDEVNDELSILINELKETDNPLLMLNLFNKAMNELIPTVSVNNLEFLHKVKEEYGVYFGSDKETDVSIIQGRKRAVHAIDLINPSKLDAVKSMLGDEGVMISATFDELHIFGQKLKKDPLFLTKISSDDYSYLFDNLYTLQTTISKKFSEYTYQADILVEALIGYRANKIPGEHPTEQIRRRAYGSFFSGAIFPQTWKMRDTLLPFRDQHHFEKITNLELNQHNVVRYLKDIGFGKYSEDDNTVRVSINKYLSETGNDTLRLPTLDKPSDPIVLLEILNRLQHKNKNVETFFDLRTSLAVVTQALPEGDMLDIKTDPGKILGEILINMRAAAKQKSLINEMIQSEGTINIESTIRKLQDRGINPLKYTSADVFNKSVQDNLQKMMQSQEINKDLDMRMSKHREVKFFDPNQLITAEIVAEKILQNMQLKTADLYFSDKIVTHQFGDGTEVFLPQEVSEHIHEVEQTVLGRGQSHGTANSKDFQRIYEMMNRNTVRSNMIDMLPKPSDRRVHAFDEKGQIIKELDMDNAYYAGIMSKLKPELKRFGEETLARQAQRAMKEIRNRKPNRPVTGELAKSILIKNELLNTYNDVAAYGSVLISGANGKFLRNHLIRQFFVSSAAGATGIVAGTFMGLPLGVATAFLSSLAWKHLERTLPNKLHLKEGKDAVTKLHTRIQALKERDINKQFEVNEYLDEYRQTKIAEVERHTRIMQDIDDSVVKDNVKKLLKENPLKDIDEANKEARKKIEKESTEYYKKYYEAMGASSKMLGHGGIGKILLEKMFPKGVGLNFRNWNANIKMHTTVGTFGTVPYFTALLFGNLQQMLLNNINSGFSSGQIAGMVAAGLISPSAGTMLAGGLAGGIVGSQLHHIIKSIKSDINFNQSTNDIAKKTGLFSHVPIGPSASVRPKQVAGIMMMEQSFSRKTVMPGLKGTRTALFSVIGGGLGHIGSTFGTAVGLPGFAMPALGAAAGAAAGHIGVRGAALTGGGFGGIMGAMALGALDPISGIPAGLIGMYGGGALGAGLGQHLGSTFADQAKIRQKSLKSRYLIPPILTPEGKVYHGHDIHRMMNELNVGTSYLRAETAELLMRDMDVHFGSAADNVISWMGGDRFKKLMIEFSESLDRYQRIQVFIDLLESGMSPKEAAKRVRETFYDYAALTEFEKTYLRNLFLFYSFMRKNFDFMTAKLIQNPDRVMGFLRLRRDFSAEATDYIEPELAAGKYHESRFILPGLNQYTKHITKYIYNERDHGKGMYKGKWFMASPLSVDGDYYKLIENTYMLGKSMVHGVLGGLFDLEPVSPMEPLQYFMGLTTPGLSWIGVGAYGQQAFMGKEVEKIPIDINDIYWAQAMQRGLGISLIDIVGTDDEEGGFITIKYTPSEELLGGEMLKPDTKKSLLSQHRLVTKSLLSPHAGHQGYGRFTPSSKSAGMAYWMLKNALLPGIARQVPILGLHLAGLGGRVGQQATAYDQADTATLVMGEEASRKLGELYFFGRGISQKEVLESTKDMNPDDRKMFMIGLLTETDESYFRDILKRNPKKGELLTELQKSILYDNFYRHPDTPAEVGITKMMQIHQLQLKTLWTINQEYLQELEYKLRE